MDFDSTLYISGKNIKEGGKEGCDGRRRSRRASRSEAMAVTAVG